MTIHPHQSWLHKNIRVRVTSNSLKGGRYYNVKVLIADVTRPGYCNVVTPDGKMLEGLL